MGRSSRIAFTDDFGDTVSVGTSLRLVNDGRLLLEIEEVEEVHQVVSFFPIERIDPHVADDRDQARRPVNDGPAICPIPTGLNFESCEHGRLFNESSGRWELFAIELNAMRQPVS